MRAIDVSQLASFCLPPTLAGAPTVGGGDVSERLLLTHLHAGTLGFITLAVAARAFRMFTEGRTIDPATERSTRRVAVAMAVAIGRYVVPFATTQGILRP